MVIDLDRCTACQGCVVACREENNVPYAGPEQMERGRAIFWMDMLTFTEGEYPDIRRSYLPAPCNHCETPPCIKVCPVGATSQSSEGIIQQIPERCIGCRMCANACPYTRRYFNWSRPHWPDQLKNALNPEISVRPHGVMEKCTLCFHRLQARREEARMEGRVLRDQDLHRLTACADACPADAIVFGDFNDHVSLASTLRESPRAFVLLEELGTHPKVVYLRSQKWGK
jgi:molybdopterin-containing oxidoreductase family iron-sulfur binding subunit